MNDDSLMWPLRDARKARKGGAAEIAQRQRARLAEAVVPRPCRLALPQLQLRARMALRHTDWVIFEPVDANYQPVAPGENSHTVHISDLDLGDSVLQRADPCPCGCPLPAASPTFAAETFSVNDFVSNGGLLLAGGLVAWTGQPWPDLLVGLAVAAIAAKGSFEILRDAWRRT